MAEPTAQQALGRQGETLAASFLRAKGYVIVAQNLWFSFGEIDILARNASTMVVVEVKTVASKGEIDPLLKINAVKQRTLWRLAAAVSERYPACDVQVDAVTLYWDQQGKAVLKHYANILED